MVSKLTPKFLLDLFIDFMDREIVVAYTIGQDRKKVSSIELWTKSVTMEALN